MKKMRKSFMKRSFIKNTQGVISIFLAILMVPFTTIAGALISAARVNSASAIFDEAISNSCDSTLATWDSFLKNRFGLLAVSQKDSEASTNQMLNTTFSKYMNENVRALSNTFFDVETNCQGMYPLANKDVLLYQILEYSKYSVPTKMAVEGFDINGIISSLENLIPGHNWLGLISSGANLGSAFVDLGNASETYADAAGETNVAKNSYDSSYSAFENSLKSISDKLTEKEKAIADYESIIAVKRAEAESKLEALTDGNNQISILTNKLDKYNELKDDLTELINKGSKALSEDIKNAVSNLISERMLSETIDVEKISPSELIEIVDEKIKSTQDSIDSSAKENSTKDSDLKKIQSELANLEAEKEKKVSSYNAEITSLRNIASDCKNAYVSDIQELINKLNSEKSARTSYDSAISKAGQSFNSLSTSAYDTLSKSDQEKMKNQEKEAQKEQLNAQKEYNAGKITQEEYQSRLQQAQVKIRLSQEAYANSKNSKTIADATSKALNGALDNMKNDINDYTEEWYDSIISKLEELKRKVAGYDIDNIEADFSRETFKKEYYISNLNLLTKAMVENAEKQILNEVTKDAIWNRITSLIDILTSLLKMLLLYDPSLNTNLDEKYYKEFKWDDIQTKNESDKELSQKYKDLFGSYNATDLISDDDFSIVESILIVLNDINYISNNIAFAGITKLVGFGEKWKEIENRFDSIKTQFMNLIDWVSNLLETVYEKTLLAGYLSYNTSCRTTYKSGTSLTGQRFNLRGQTSNIETSFKEINGIGDFVSLFGSVFAGETSKCFVGAETEYLINGKDSEILNQLYTFLELYVIRFICNVFKVATNPEVAQIAASVTIASPIVYVLYAFLEPLVDCVILTNGGANYIVKNNLYLVPSGLNSLFTELTSLVKTSSQISKSKQSFEDAVNKYSDGDKYHIDVEQSENSDMSSATVGKSKIEYGKLKYTDYLFIYLTFCNTDKLMDRFRKIVQMESVQNLYVKNGEKSWEGINFDIARSYTYLRAEAKFSTNEFIRISGSNINMNKRLLYRGY